MAKNPAPHYQAGAQDDGEDDSDEEFLVQTSHNAPSTTTATAGPSHSHKKSISATAQPSSSTATTQGHPPRSQPSHVSGVQVDREALVRKKLLENFYGKSAVEAAAPSVLSPTSAGDDLDDDDDDDDDEGENFSNRRSLDPARNRNKGSASAGTSNTTITIEDLDSPHFDAMEHTRKLVQGSSVYHLLDTHERLSLQIRTLDSTMQSLVYENYSRFIDATEAIRSVSVHVQANEDGLARLTAGMDTLDRQSRDMELALGSLRDQVAEKIRVQRLLTRLEALLKLPRTLADHMQRGQYTLATRTYAQAYAILSQHAGKGFESLKTIETECQLLLKRMQVNLAGKLKHWTGGVGGGDGSEADDDVDLGEEEDADREAVGTVERSPGLTEEGSTVPDPPKSMAEIMECSGTLYIMLQESQGNSQSSQQDSGHGTKAAPMKLELEFQAEDLLSMSTEAAMRLLDRILDTHLVEIQERRFVAVAPFQDNVMIGLKLLKASTPGMEQETKTSLNHPPPASSSVLVPANYLDAVLEGAILFRRRFGAEASAAAHVQEFVLEAYSSFLSHVRSVFLEESLQAGREDGSTTPEPTATADDLEGREEADGVYKEISTALTLLVQIVRSFSASLTLPEIGLREDVTSRLVEQAKELTGSLIRRRVEQKFHELRLSVVRDCLIPFATRAVTERASALENGLPALALVVQIANGTLFDCLQLVDDTIRSVFSGGIESMGDSVGVSSDLPSLREAVQSSSRKFVAWLASALEMLAGGDTSDTRLIAEAPIANNADEHAEKSINFEGQEIKVSNPAAPDDISDLPNQDDLVMDLINTAVSILLRTSGGSQEEFVHSDYILAILELCKLAGSSMAESLDQSIAIHAGGGKKKSRGLFPPGETPYGNGTSRDESRISKRFQLAACRVFVLYVSNQGMKAASIACSDIDDVSLKTEDDIPTAPQQLFFDVLAVVKTTCLECANVFGGNKRAGPFPAGDDERPTSFGLSSPLLSRKSGIQLDIERMFKERVTIYTHPSEFVDLSRNSAVFLLLKIVLRAVREYARLYYFSTGGYRQLQVDTEFIKRMLPHYLDSDFSASAVNAVSALSSLLDDLMEVIEERCFDESCAHDDLTKRQSEDTVRDFMGAIDQLEPATRDKFIISDE